MNRQMMSRQMKWMTVAACGLALVVAAGRMQRVSWADEGSESDAMKRLDRIVEKLDRIVDGMGRQGPGGPEMRSRPPRLPEGERGSRSEWMEQRMKDMSPEQRERMEKRRDEMRRRWEEMPPEQRERMEQWMKEGRQRMDDARERMEKAKDKFQEMERRIERLEAEVAKLKRERD